MKLGVLTSGGDSPGMNAAVRAVVRNSIYNDIEIYAIRYGYTGIFEQKIEKMNIYSVADIIQRGGTTLHTSRCPMMMSSEGVDRAAEILNAYAFDALIVIGGDGSYRGAAELSARGINVIVLPGTIDNDVASSEYSIGFDTAVNTAIEAIGRIRDTSLSHNRASVVEVMGRNCGNIALFSGLAGGAEAICVPELSYDADAICAKMLRGKDRGKLHSIIVYAEGAGDVDKFCAEIAEKTQMTTNKTSLGYIQRGGAPTAFDRILASRMGAMAVEAAIAGRMNTAVCMRGGKYVLMELSEALSMQFVFDSEAYRIAMQLSI